MNNTTPKTEAPAAARTALATIETDNEDTGRALNAFGSAQNFTAAQRMATALSQSTIIPEVYRGNLPNVLIAMEVASRIGASVFMVMQNLDIIHGRPGWRSTFLIATVNASRRFTSLRFRWEGKRGEPSWGCRAFAKDRETGEECPGTLIDMAMANAEGWATRQGSKWRTMPEQMLMYRSAAFWTRIYAPELSLGLHTSDEVEDMPSEPVRYDVTATVEPVKSLEDQIRERSVSPATVPAQPVASNGNANVGPMPASFATESRPGVSAEHPQGVGAGLAKPSETSSSRGRLPRRPPEKQPDIPFENPAQEKPQPQTVAESKTKTDEEWNAWAEIAWKACDKVTTQEDLAAVTAMVEAAVGDAPLRLLMPVKSQLDEARKRIQTTSAT